jgi:hypothetical protein
VGCDNGAFVKTDESKEQVRGLGCGRSRQARGLPFCGGNGKRGAWRNPSAAEAGKRRGCRGETPRTPPAAGEVAAGRGGSAKKAVLVRQKRVNKGCRGDTPPKPPRSAAHTLGRNCAALTLLFPRYRRTCRSGSWRRGRWARTA